MAFDPIVLIVALCATAVFVLGFRYSGLIRTAQTAINLAREAGNVMSSKTMTDEEKEKAIQKASIGLLGSFVQITIRAAIVLGATIGTIYLAEIAGVTSADAVMAFLLTWQAIVGISVGVMLIIFVGRRL